VSDGGAAATGDASDASDALANLSDGGDEEVTTTASSYLVNPAHTNSVVDPSLVPPLAARWAFNVPSATFLYPLIAGGRVYLVYTANKNGSGGQLVALDETSGTTLWGPVDLGGLSVAGHAYDAGRVFTFSYDTGRVRAFDGVTGAALWTYSLAGTSAPSGPPTAYRGVLYIAWAGSIVALDEMSGAVRWTDAVASRNSTSPAVNEDGVFVSFGCGETYAFDRMTGSTLWHHEPSCYGGEDSIPAVFAGRVYVPDQDSQSLLVLDMKTGDVAANLPCYIYPAFDGSRAYCDTPTPLLAIDLPSGNNAWSFSGDKGLHFWPFVAGGTVYVASQSGEMFGVDESTGALAWSMQVASFGPPAGAEGVLITTPYESGVVIAYGHVDEPDASVVLGDGGTPVPVYLTSGESPGKLALGATNVYWTSGNGAQIRAVPKAGGQPVTVVAGPPNSPGWGIAVDSTNIYWSTTSAVLSMPLTGSMPNTLAPNLLRGAQNVAVSATDVYWATVPGPDAVQSVPIDGGAVTTIVSDPNGTTALAVDTSNLYWSTTSGLYRAALAGGSPTSIGPAVASLAVDATDVYYVLDSAVSAGTIRRVPIAGGAGTTLASGRLGSLVAVAVDDRNVYWIEGNGTIQQGAVAALPKSGGQVAVLASGLTDPAAIAVDSTGIYFTSGGDITKIPK
jgi:outer membrane protein assembly factor BamB